MTILDEIIATDPRKQAVTIIRTVNIETYMVAELTGVESGKRRLDPYFDFENFAKFPSDSGVVSGDLILCGSLYYLAMAIEEKRFVDEEISGYRVTLYKCNSVISDYRLDITTRKPTVLQKSGIHCLITQVRAQAWDEDKATMLRQYRGRQQPFQVFAQAASGISVESILVDQSTRRFRVSKESDVFISENILQAEILWER